MAKKKMEFYAEAKRLEKTERLVEDANVVLDVGQDAAGLTGVVVRVRVRVRNAGNGPVGFCFRGC